MVRAHNFDAMLLLGSCTISDTANTMAGGFLDPYRDRFSSATYEEIVK